MRCRFIRSWSVAVVLLCSFLSASVCKAQGFAAPGGLSPEEIEKLKTLQKSNPGLFEKLEKSIPQKGSQIEIQKTGMMDDSIPGSVAEADKRLHKIKKSEEAAKKTDNEQKKQPENEKTTQPDEKANAQLPDMEQFFQDTSGDGLDSRPERFGYDIFENSSTTFSSSLSVPVPGDYKIGPDDEFTITLWGVVEGTYKLKVDYNGNIALPKVGVVSIAGSRYDELVPFLKTKLARFYPEVNISVSLDKIKTFRVYIVGSVKKPGAYLVNSLSTVLNALLIAGGPAENGTMRNIRVVRNAKTVAYFDVYDFLLAGDKTQDIRLVPEDTIFVGLIGDTVTVAGNVSRPGIYETKGKNSLGEMLELAGGVSPSAYLNRVQIERTMPHEKKTVVDLDLSGDGSGGTGLSVPVEDKDIIKVYQIKDELQNVVYLKGNVLRPGPYQITGKMKVSDLLSKEDDLKEGTYMGHAEIIRKNGVFAAPEIISFNLAKAIKDKDPQHDLALASRDQIRIFPEEYFTGKKYVTISGAVNKPGRYKLYTGTSMSHLIDMAGNLSDEAYLEKAEIHRVSDYNNPAAAKSIITVNLASVLDNLNDIPLEPLDEVVVYRKSYFANAQKVTIKGEVRAPGIYDYLDQMSLSDLVFQAGQLTNNAYLERVEIHRALDYTKQNFNKKLILVNMKDLINKKVPPVKLKPLDEVIVYSKRVISDTPTVAVNGAVKHPGNVELIDGMRIKDLIYKAGPRIDSYLNEAELSRRIHTKGTADVTIKRLRVNIKKLMDGNEDENILLKDGDVLSVMTITNMKPFRQVQLTGEFMFPGTYTLKEGENLSSVIKRAGGYTKRAYLKGAFFTRQTVKERELVRAEAFKREHRKKLLSHAAGFTSQTQEELSAKQAAMNAKLKELEEISDSGITGRMVIRLLPMDSFEGTQGDIQLENGDELFVPAIPSEVSVIGSVKNPVTLSYSQTKSALDYVRMAGGFTKEADKEQMHIMKMDGSSVQYSQNMILEPGDAIVVPPNVEARTRLLPLWKDILTIMGQTAVTLAVILNIL